MILQDKAVMYAWEHCFTENGVRQWIDKNLVRYEKDGFSYFAAIEKQSNQVVGVMGPLIELINGVLHIGIAYLLKKAFWGKGYATEGVKACMEYAFHVLHADKVIAQIRPSNIRSRNVARAVGMHIEGAYNKRYHGKDMLHLIYVKKKPG